MRKAGVISVGDLLFFCTERVWRLGGQDRRGMIHGLVVKVRHTLFTVGVNMFVV